MNKVVNIYTDGSCSGNPGPGGWSAIIITNTKKYVIAGYENNSTNNRMEMIAAINAINEAKNFQIINIYTDSNYLRNGITIWIKKWKTNNWKSASKKSILNRDLWEKLDHINNLSNVKWNWVKGHEDNVNNNLADKYAVEAMKQQKQLRFDI